jgi:hypothetical protein
MTLAQDIRPIHVRSRAEDLDSDSDDSEQSTEWNLRRSAAAGLDALATVFRNDMLPILFPHLEKGLNEKSVRSSLSCAQVHACALIKRQDWKVKEAAVLAIGAVAEGCMEGLAPYLPQLLPHLLTLLSDSRPLIRSITYSLPHLLLACDTDTALTRRQVLDDLAVLDLHRHPGAGEVPAAGRERAPALHLRPQQARAGGRLLRFRHSRGT